MSDIPIRRDNAAGTAVTEDKGETCMARPKSEGSEDITLAVELLMRKAEEFLANTELNPDERYSFKKLMARFKDPTKQPLSEQESHRAKRVARTFSNYLYEQAADYYRQMRTNLVTVDQTKLKRLLQARNYFETMELSVLLGTDSLESLLNLKHKEIEERLKEALEKHKSLLKDMERTSLSEEKVEEAIKELEEQFQEEFEQWYVDETTFGASDRVAKIETSLIQKNPSEKVKFYCCEATNCYIHGVFEACTIVCRSVLEFVLRENVRLPLNEDKKKEITLEGTINWAERTDQLTHGLSKKAHSIRIRGNNSIHRGKSDEESAFTSLMELQEILTHMYG